MPRKKESPEELLNAYCTAHEAAQRLTIIHGRKIPASYVSKLVKSHKHSVHYRKFGNMTLYLIADIEQVQIRQKDVIVP